MPSSDMLSDVDIGAIAVSGGVMLIYNLGFFASTAAMSHSPMQLALNLANAELWIEKHKEKDDPQSVTLAIQTLRSTILVAVFIGGNALSFAYSIVNEYDADTQSMRKNVRAVILTILLFASFLCWACVIRNASHLGYMVGTLGYTDKKVTVDHTSDKIDDTPMDSVCDEQTTNTEVTAVNKKKELRIAQYRHSQEYRKKRAGVFLKQMLVYFRWVLIISCQCAQSSEMCIYLIS